MTGPRIAATRPASDTLTSRLRRTAARYLKRSSKSRREAYLDGLGTRDLWTFIHINKCGGTSVEQALGIPKIHDTARERRERIGAERWARLATFSIVRHPYDRARSLYRYRVRTGQTGMDAQPIAFEDWVRAVFRDQDPAYHDRALMFRPAHDWLADADGRIMVDLVAKLEAIETDWPKIQALIGTTAALPRANTTAAERTAAPLSAESRAILADRFAADFETFGYDP